MDKLSKTELYHKQKINIPFSILEVSLNQTNYIKDKNSNDNLDLNCNVNILKNSQTISFKPYDEENKTIVIICDKKDEDTIVRQEKIEEIKITIKDTNCIFPTNIDENINKELSSEHVNKNEKNYIEGKFENTINSIKYDTLGVKQYVNLVNYSKDYNEMCLYEFYKLKIEESRNINIFNFLEENSRKKVIMKTLTFEPNSLIDRLYNLCVTTIKNMNYILLDFFIIKNNKFLLDIVSNLKILEKHQN